MKRKRFSKAKLAAYVNRRLGQLQQKWHFDETNGTQQLVEPGPIASLIKATAYGEREALKRLLYDFDL